MKLHGFPLILIITIAGIAILSMKPGLLLLTPTRWIYACLSISVCGIILSSALALSRGNHYPKLFFNKHFFLTNTLPLFVLLLITLMIYILRYSLEVKIDFLPNIVSTVLFGNYTLPLLFFSFGIDVPYTLLQKKPSN